MLHTQRAATHSVCTLSLLLLITCTKGQLVYEVHSNPSLPLLHLPRLPVTLILS
uniref:Uncharacterized protein n=1 Tax=Anguilla anguilla TaxID=7936 RepID=A0A0E9W4H0_ANGAN